MISGSLNQETLSRLCQAMLKIRLAEEKIAQVYPSDKIQSPIHLCIGQEAVSAGVCLALDSKDHIYGTYRGHGLYIARGGNLKKLFAELYGKDTGCARGKGGSMHVVALEVGLMGCSAIVASTIPVATGDALASSIQGEHRVVASVFGDGAVDEGVFFESMNFAALKNLPILYICENNNYAVHSRVSDRHKQTELFRYGQALGLAGERFEGNDVQVVYSAVKSAMEKIRSGGEPMLLEFITYRIYEHVGPGKDHQEIYRDHEKLTEAFKNDPLAKIKSVLKQKFGVKEALFEQWEKGFRKEVEEAVAFAEQSPFPDPSSLYDDLYKERNGYPNLWPSA